MLAFTCGEKTCALVLAAVLLWIGNRKRVLTEALLPTPYDEGKVASEAPTAQSDQGSQRGMEKHEKRRRRVFVHIPQKHVWARQIHKMRSR